MRWTNRAIVAHFALQRHVLMSCNDEEKRATTRERIVPNTIGMPEGGLIPIIDGDGSGGPGEGHVSLVTGKLGAHPRLVQVASLQPRPPQSRAPSKSFQTGATKPTKKLWRVDGLPIHQPVHTLRVFNIIGVPNKYSHDLIHLVASPFWQRNGRRVECHCCCKNGLSQSDPSMLRNVLLLTPWKSTMDLFDERLKVNLP